MNKKSAKKVLILLGSPRKNSNSALLAKKIAAGAASSGAKTEEAFIHGMKIAPCQSCYACQKPKTKGCSIDDDMQALYPKLLEADAWIIASPVYWFNMSAQTKLWMDRCFALPAYGKNPFSGKRIAIAMAYGDVDPFASGCVNAVRTFQDAFSYVGAKLIGTVYGSAMNPGEIGVQEKLLEQAEALGRKLVED